MSDYSYTPSTQSSLEWALSALSARQRKAYAKYTNYYDGQHDLRFATAKFRSVFGQLVKEFAENMCPAVVDSLGDRLRILGFKTSEATLTKTQLPAPFPGAPSHTQVLQSDPFGEQMLDIWERNVMNVKASEVHIESLRSGDAYVVVWPDGQGNAAIWPQCAYECAVQYDPNTPGKILQGCKSWYDDIARQWRLNIYTSDTIYKYVMERKTKDFSSKAASWKLFTVVNSPYDVPAMFHFPNKTLGKLGVSELKDVIPLQNALNKSVMDMLIAMEFAAYRQRYIIGMEQEIDPETGEPVDQNAKNYGIDRMMAIPDIEARVGEFGATELKQFLEVGEKFWASTARVTGTPLHYFLITKGDFPSGEAMKSAEARFTNRIMDRQTSWGGLWAQVLLFAAKIEGVAVPADAKDFTMETVWAPAVHRSEAELADAAVKKKSVGVSRSQLLRELGYTEDEIAMQITEADAYEAWVAELKSRRVTTTGTLGPSGEIVDPQASATSPGNAEPNSSTGTGGTQGVQQ